MTYNMNCSIKDFNNVDVDKMTKLITACKKGNLAEAVQHITAEAIELNIQDEYGWTVLMSASQKGYTEIVRLLLEKGANPNIQDQNGWTSLTWAIQSGHIDVVRLLLEKGANPNLRFNKYSPTAITFAFKGGHTDIVKLLLVEGAHPPTSILLKEMKPEIGEIFAEYYRASLCKSFDKVGVPRDVIQHVMEHI